MKKAMGVLGMASLFIFMAMTSYALMDKKPIKAADLSSLKGSWKGERVIKSASKPEKFPVEMEINNAKFPLKGKLTLHNVIREGAKGRTEVVGLEKSELTKDGNLLIKTKKFQVELSLSTEGSKMELKGDYQFENLNGTVYLYKN
jgi:hypothetical protein